MAIDADKLRYLNMCIYASDISFLNVDYVPSSVQSRINYTNFYSLYQKEIKKYSQYLEVTEDISEVIAKRTINLLSDFSIENIFISLTTNNSILFRFTTDANYFEYKLEVFLNYDPEDTEDIEAILHIYQNSEKVSYYGALSDFYLLIKQTILEPDFYVPEEKMYNPFNTSPSQAQLPIATYS